MTFEYDVPSYRRTTTPPLPPSPHKHHYPLPLPAPYHTHHSKSKYSPSSCASDISRILDPSYASGPSSSSSQSSSSPSSGVVAVYVDHHGDLHDPDFRPFASVVNPRRRSSSTKPPNKRYSSGNGINLTHYDYNAVQWQDKDDDDEQADAYSDKESLHRHTRYRATPAYHSYTPRSRSESRTRSNSARAASPRHYLPHYEAPAVFSSSPEDVNLNNDVEDDIPEEDPFVDDDEEVVGFDQEEERMGRRLVKSRRSKTKKSKGKSSKDMKELKEKITVLTSPISISPDPASPFSPHDENEADVDAEYLNEVGQQDWTPTCTQSVRRQWQSLTLSLRFSIFRTKRRLRRRFSKPST